MTSTITTTLKRMLRPQAQAAAVHFHLHRDGRPFVCDLDRCDSAALTLGEVDRAHRASGH